MRVIKQFCSHFPHPTDLFTVCLNFDKSVQINSCTMNCYFTTSGNPLLRTEIVGLHRPNSTHNPREGEDSQLTYTLKCQLWIPMSIVNPPPGLTLLKAVQDVHVLWIVNCESPPPPNIAPLQGLPIVKVGQDVCALWNVNCQSSSLGFLKSWAFTFGHALPNIKS